MQNQRDLSVYRIVQQRESLFCVKVQCVCRLSNFRVLTGRVDIIGYSVLIVNKSKVVYYTVTFSVEASPMGS